MSQQQIINSLLNLHQLFTNLHQLKFKGRKILEDLINTRYQESLLIKNMRKNSESIIFDHAIKYCKISQGEIVSNFESSVLESYISFCSKVKLNTDYLSNNLKRKDFEQPLSPYKFLLLQLIHLGLDLGEGYHKQQELIQSLWSKILTSILKGDESEQDLKELMLHVGFESYIEQQKRDSWRLKLAAVGNQRYNPRK